MSHKLIGCILVTALTFICAFCDPVSDIEYKIQNNTESKVEVKIFGWWEYGTDKRDSTKVLTKGESMSIFHQEQFGFAEKPKMDSVNFCDSIQVKDIDRKILSRKTFKSLSEWTYVKKGDYNSDYILFLDASDF